MDAKKKIIKNIVWKELETLRLGRDKYIEFEWGRKKFILRRTK